MCWLKIRVTSLSCAAGNVKCLPLMAEPEKHQILYDDECALCTFQMRLLTWLDWCDVARLLPVSDPATLQLVPGLTRQDLLEAIHCVPREGPVLRGARALRFVGMRMPLLVPMALVLWVPGVIWVAERIYMAISRNRHILGKIFGCKDACAIMPQRKREGEKLAELAEKPPENG